MFAKPAGRRDVRLNRVSGWLGLGAFTVFLVIGVLIRLPLDTAVAIPGALISLAAVPLFLVKSRFLLVYAGVATAGIAMLVSVGEGSGNVGWFAVCVVAAWCVLAGGVLIGAIYWAATVVMFGAESLLTVRDPGWASWIAGVTLTVLAATLIRHQLVLMERLREAQAGLVERSRAEERNRIARELHDVIAHSLTVSLLHVSSARLAIEHDPADAARALAEAERLGRQSLAEVRATMGLPDSSSPGGIAPPVPGIVDLARLVEQMSHAGIEASLVVDADLATLPATTGSTVYRIVQEALTNAAKHARGATVAVVAAARQGCVEISIDSAGSPGHGSGMGLTSMRERAEAVGGTCTAGPGGSGWLVQASLPLSAVPEVGGDAR